MGWFDTAISVVSTIGKVAGALTGIVTLDHPDKSRFRHVSYNLRPKSNQSDTGILSFVNLQDDNDSGVHIAAFNTDQQAAYTLSIPGNAQSGVEALDVTVPKMSTINVSPLFNAAAQSGIERLQITPQFYETSGIGQDKKYTTIHGSTNKKIVGSEQVAVNFGAYFTAKLRVTPRTLQISVLGGLSLIAITVLNVGGATDNVVRIINAVRKSGSQFNDDNTQITVELPDTIDITDGIVSIDVLAQVDNFNPNTIAQSSYPYQPRLISDSELLLLKERIG